MIRTAEAVIDEHGNVRLLEPVEVAGARRALVTILDEELTSLRHATAILSERSLGPKIGTDQRRTPRGRTFNGIGSPGAFSVFRSIAIQAATCRAPSHSANTVSAVWQRENRGRRASPDLPTRIFHIRSQPSISVLPQQPLGANRQRSECACAGTAFDRADPEPFRFQYGVRRSELGNVESGMNS